jgi:hypothetical protein
MPDDHFGEEIASRYDDPSDEMFQPSAIEPVVDFLAALAGDGAAVEVGKGHQPRTRQRSRETHRTSG